MSLEEAADIRGYGADVVIVTLPQDDKLLAALRAASLPRLVLVPQDAIAPVGYNALEDWVRLPADPRANATPGTTPLCIWSVDQCTVESRKPWHEWWGTVTVSGNRKGATTRKQLKPATAGNLSC